VRKLILSKQYLFGGYTSTSWKNTNETIWDNDPSAFLFTLINPHEIPPTKNMIFVFMSTVTKTHEESVRFQTAIMMLQEWDLKILLKK
jgi:hypothetical protein